MLKKVGTLLFEYSGFLILGAAVALIWANVHNPSYERFKKIPLVPQHHEGQHAGEHDGEKSKEPSSHEPEIGKHKEEASDHKTEGAGHGNVEEEGPLGAKHEGVPRAHHFDIAFLVNDILMALFFALAGKEVWEALLPGGALSSPRKAATPLMATLGGMAGPASLYITGALLLGSHHLIRGWAIPCATDIAFSYLIARLVFGPKHPAIPFLLLLAIADDAGGLIILATVYTAGPIRLELFFGLVVPAVIIGFMFRKLNIRSWVPYLLVPGVMSWLGFFFGGIHPALGLIPVIPTLPHAHTDLGIFCREELGRKDPLNKFEHDMRIPVEIILGFFGLVNAGVMVSNIGQATGLVTIGLLVGKPMGILLFTLLAVKLLKCEMPTGMGWRDVFTLGIAASIGFTVALFICTVAFVPKGPEDVLTYRALEAAKLGALLSFTGSGLTYISGRIVRVKKIMAKDGAGV